MRLTAAEFRKLKGLGIISAIFVISILVVVFGHEVICSILDKWELGFKWWASVPGDERWSALGGLVILLLIIIVAAFVFCWMGHKTIAFFRVTYFDLDSRVSK